mmetsp:Transcript_12261/g.40753  ORF Transcript_12261/g.40753 Transcript_12261/m.40753 type:complete len:207 (+) Transcript_12261:1761-2381(+)
MSKGGAGGSAAAETASAAKSKSGGAAYRNSAAGRGKTNECSLCSAPSHHPCPFRISTGNVNIHTRATGHIDSRTTALNKYQRCHSGAPRIRSTARACRFETCAHPCAHRSCWPLYAAKLLGNSVSTTVFARNLLLYPAHHKRKDKSVLSSKAVASQPPAAVTARALQVAPAPAPTTHPVAFDNTALPACLCASSLIDCAIVSALSS